jgi:hypothetical protein
LAFWHWHGDASATVIGIAGPASPCRTFIYPNHSTRFSRKSEGKLVDFSRILAGHLEIFFRLRGYTDWCKGEAFATQLKLASMPVMVGVLINLNAGANASPLSSNQISFQEKQAMFKRSKQYPIVISFVLLLVASLIAGCAGTAAPVATQPAATAKASAAQPTAVNAAPPATTAPAATTELTKDTISTQALAFNNKAWQYDATNDVYWQIGIVYCTKPETTDYESLGIYVPGAYLTATPNGDGTFTAVLNEKGAINGFTAKTAPLVFPVDTPGYAQHKAPTAYSYDEISDYMKAGFIYINAGLRGKENGYDANNKLIYSGGAPWGVTDLKAAVRYIRYNKNVLPGNTDSIFIFGMSGGGAQTSVMGASGNSKLYNPYLESIGAAMVDATGAPISDAVSGAMAWCPITSLDYADEAYEWNMGQYVSAGTRADTTFTSALSKDLATAFAEYINKLGIKDQNGNVLTLQTSADGIYAAGSYYDYLKSTVEQSLNNFLVDTTFPYTETSGGMGGGFPGGGMPAGGPPPDGGMPQGGTPPTGTLPAGGMPSGNVSSSEFTTTTYQTAQDYIDALNKDAQWVTYDAATNTAKITSLAGFVNSQKIPSKNVGAFDALDRSAGENNLFGNDASDSLHFDPVLAGLLATNQAQYAKYSDWDASLVAAYANDLKAVDKLGNSIQYRMNMYNPMYYLLKYYDGYQTSTPAEHWRINTGIKQGDTANTVELNLALALKNYAGVKDVAFTTVWNQGHTEAERTGDSTTNFIAWVTDVVKK